MCIFASSVKTFPLLSKHWQAFTSIDGSDTPSDTSSAVAGADEDCPSRVSITSSPWLITSAKALLPIKQIISHTKRSTFILPHVLSTSVFLT